MDNPNQALPPIDANKSPLSDAEQRELEQLANEFADSEFENLWNQVKDDAKDLSKRELAEEFFYQGVLALLAIQKMEDKEFEEQEARRFQYE